MRTLTSLIIMVTCFETAYAVEADAVLIGSNARVPYKRQNSVLLLDVNATAAAFGWQAKVVRPGKLLTLCSSSEPGGICIPIQLAGVRMNASSDALFMDSKILARALRFTIQDSGSRVNLKPGRSPAADAAVPAYNTAWGAGRGFRVGQTLPDIPLYSMDGQEVRFSKFLGKQYIIYCWASW